MALMGTIAPWANTYIAQSRKRGKFNKSTGQHVGYTLASLDRSFGARPMEQFGARAIERWIEQNDHLKPGTRATYLGHVREFTKWLRRHRVVFGDPFAEIESPRRGRPMPRPIPRGDVDALLAVAPDNRGRLIVLLMWSMGLRCVGVANLQIEDIDHVNNVLIVREKFGNERRLPVTPIVGAAIETYLRERPGRSGPLIRSNLWESVPRDVGISAGHVSTLVGRWMRTAGVKHYAGDGRGAHALRHTALTEVAEATGDAFIVQELAGWSSPATAANYVRRASTERLREALAKRDGVAK